ncbi:MAG TPA: hypothetical protein PLR99_10740 [Polyangiaceae bacterium]|nr:hypothetical protein [Polyangiaceae bacterium]
MTPEDADVAFALDGFPGVEAVYAVDSTTPGEIRYVVMIDPERYAYHIGAIHYAIARARGRKTTEDVELCYAERPRDPRVALRPLRLDAGTRADARARAERTVDVFAEDLPPRAPPPAPYSVSALFDSPPPPDCSFDERGWTSSLLALGWDVLVADDRITEAVVRRVYRAPSRVEAFPTLALATEAVLARPFDRLVVSAPFAFGPQGLLARLATRPWGRLTQVAIIAESPVSARWETLARAQRCVLLARPLTAPYLDARAGPRVTLEGMKRSAAATQRAARPRVLLVDAEPLADTSDRYALFWAPTVPEAEAALRAGEFRLLVCDASMPTGHGRELAYRRLWSAFPSMKAHTVLLTTAAAAAALPPPSGRSPRPRPLLSRPLTHRALEDALDAFGSRGADDR